MPVIAPQLPIRYLASTDAGLYGRTAFRYLLEILKIAKTVHLGCMSEGMSVQWENAARFMTPPPTGKFINIVCCAPERWVWQHGVKVGAEHIGQTVELYTAGMHNVLIAASMPLTEEQHAAAARYQALVVPTVELFEQWERVGLAPRLYETPFEDLESFAQLLRP
jgi:hypothetical protein